MSLNWRLFQLTQGFRLRLLGAAVLGLVASMAGIGRLALSGYVLGLVFQGRPLSTLVLPVIGVAVCILLRAVLEYAKEATGNRTASDIKLRLRQHIYEHMLELGPGHFDQERTGDVVLAMVEGVEQLETFLGQYFPQFAVAALTPLLIFAGMAWLDVPTALVFVGFALFTLVAPFFFTRWTAASSLQRRDAYSALGADFLDAVQGLATLKAFGQSGAHGTMLAQRSRHLYRSTMGVLAVNIITSGVITLGISAGAGVALGWGALRVSQGTLALPTLLVVLMLGVEVFRPLRELSRLYHRGMIAVSTAKAIFAILDAVPMVQEPAQPVMPAEERLTLTPEVRFDGVSFDYPKRPHVLHTIDLTVEPGQRLGLVGPSGAGKSTLIWLLLRFFDPQQGRVLLGGYDLRTLPCRSCGVISPWSCRTLISFTVRSLRISVLASLMRPRRNLKRQPVRPTPMSLSWHCRTAMPRWSASVVCVSPVASASVWQLPVHCSRTHLSSSSTKLCRASIQRMKPSFRKPWSA